MRISDWSSDVCSSDLVGVGDDHFLLLALAGDFGLADLGAEADVQALLLELARGGLRHFRVCDGQEVGQRFEHGHFRAQALPHAAQLQPDPSSEEHTSELPPLMRISYAVSCLKKKTTTY